MGKRLEVCWPYEEDGKKVKIWASGTVKRVADGLNDKRSSRAKKILPAGELLWAWDADADFDEQEGEEWLVFYFPRSGTSTCITAGTSVRASYLRTQSARPRVAQRARGGRRGWTWMPL